MHNSLSFYYLRPQINIAPSGSIGEMQGKRIASECMQLLEKNRTENGVEKVGLSQRRQGKKDLGKRNSSSQKKESILKMKISHYDQLLQKMF